MLAFYTALLSILNSPVHAWDEFAKMWYWITAIALGFGLQIGMYAHIKITLKHREGTGAVAASGGMSGAAMAACCAHHLSEVLPLLGLAALSTFLVRYQSAFLAVGLASNIIGIIIMLTHIKKHGLYARGGLLDRLLRKQDMLHAAAALAVGALIAFSIIGFI
jgi:hypothetical protein